MPESPDIEAVVDALKRRGRPESTDHWPDGNPDYVTEYSLTQEHVPTLIELATTYSDADQDDAAVYAQIHAWRALGQLGAVEAVQPLLDVQEELDDIDDDWYLEEFGLVFGLIGPLAIEPVAAYVRDTTHGLFPRQNAAGGLSEIAKRSPASREQVVGILVEVLGRHEQDHADLNGALVGDLLNLKATEAAEAIERAFEANVIDPTVVGDWGVVRQELGVDGLGLAPDRTPGWLTLGERMGMPDTDGRSRMVDPERVAAIEQRIRTQTQRKLKESKQQARAKRKEQKKSRKRNRKPR
ncbi:MAG: DUF1186 domain-containing protein [Fuerstiella sp.]|nr:DUF1186 domain-containing protein [Fuerstiella sp.]MCP4852980.1 DUF1186 domain-containing protein [Fuerstiella sp.]